VQLLGQRTVYNGNRPEVHAVFRRWHRQARRYEEAKLLLGETPVPVAELARYYGDGDELDLAFNFPFLSAPFEAPALQKVVADTERLLPADAWPAWTGSNHDVSRMATRWGAGDPRRTRLALVMLLCLRGTPVLYQGDEIGLEDGVVEPPDLRDPLGVRYWPAYAGRDAARTPMPWHARPGGGFTNPGTRPWLPMADPALCNVGDQRADATSVLTLVRDLLALRRRSPDLQTGSYRAVAATDTVWVWRRGEHVTVILNLSDQGTRVAAPPGQVIIGTDRGRDHEHIGDTIALDPWEGVVLAHEGAGAP
jgi:alpha-glucosidase